MSDLMTTHEVADYLRIKERRVYDLVKEGRIPCTRVTGKWLFPKRLIDLWLARGTEFSGVAPGLADNPPAVVVGSHDPLLDWALRESGSDLAAMCGGSLDGLERFVTGDAAVCGLHVFEPETGTYNENLVAQYTAGMGAVLIEWARRRQGLVLAQGNPMGIGGIADLAEKKAQVVTRQEAAGSHILMLHLLDEAGLSLSDLAVLDQPARNETDLGLAVVEGRADAGLAVEAVARQYRLDFVPLRDERYDLLMRRRDYFEPSVQKVLALARTPAFAERAAALGGYDVGQLGRVIYNGG